MVMYAWFQRKRRVEQFVLFNAAPAPSFSEKA
jgi:hypothetical protein